MDRNLKIVNVSQGKNGGAGIAAFRLHKAFIMNGYYSEFVDLDEMYLEHIGEAKSFSIKAFIGAFHLWERTIIWIGQFFKFKKYRKKYNLEVLSNGLFNSPKFNHVVGDLCEDADIIIFHWVFKKINNSLIKKLSRNKRVYIYLHDERINHGLFHYTNDKKRSPFFLFFIDLLLKRVYKFSNWEKNIVFLSPSKWLMKNTIQHDNSRRVFYFPPSIDLRNYPLSESYVKETKVVDILFLCQSTDNYRKGFYFLENIISEFSNKENFKFHVIGGADKIGKIGNVTYYGFIQQEDIYKLLNSMDYFLLPSIEDNMPNVMMEALCFGCKVICFDVGGMSEEIVHGVNGYLANQKSVEAFSAVVNEALLCHESNIWDRKEMGNFYRNYFSAQRQIGVFRNVHNSITYDLF